MDLSNEASWNFNWSNYYPIFYAWHVMLSWCKCIQMTFRTKWPPPWESVLPSPCSSPHTHLVQWSCHTHPSPAALEHSQSHVYLLVCVCMCLCVYIHHCIFDSSSREHDAFLPHILWLKLPQQSIQCTYMHKTTVYPRPPQDNTLQPIFFAANKQPAAFTVSELCSYTNLFTTWLMSTHFEQSEQGLF